MGRKKKRKKGKPQKRKNTVKRGSLVSDVLALLNSNPSKSYSKRQVIKQLKVRDKQSKDEIAGILFNLRDQSKIQQLRNGQFQSLLKSEYNTGYVDHVNQRFCYVNVEGLDEDIWVKLSNMNFAIHGDKVKLKIFPTRKHGRRREGEILEILERSKSEFVGRVERYKESAFVIPDNKKLYFDVFVPPDAINKATDNDKVVVQVKEWATTEKNPKGIITRILGKTGEHEAEMHSIMAEFNLPFDFPDAIKQEAEKIKDGVTGEEVRARRDMRETLTLTIDPDDAKDFDDALSIKKLENGHYEIGIHIADVTHYLKEGSALDKEALKRGTSVYLVDRTIPMLPEKLSNELCSLRPNEDKLTFSSVFELTGKGEVLKEWYGKTVTHSDRRFTYEEAQKILEDGKGQYAEELKILNNIALQLRKDRFEKGSINFETQEYKFELDKKGKPVAIFPKVRKDAHKLIEDYMLLANKKVAEFINRKSSKDKEYTFVYRIHNLPDLEKLSAFSVFAKKFGHELDFKKGSIAKSLNELIKDIEGKPEENVLQMLAIRTMAKAIYSTESKGHFGLAFPHYTHFTSPIRRYPDVMVHRLLFHYLNRGTPPNPSPYEEKCDHSSVQEKNASDAERASVKYKQVEFMSTRLGETYEGIISGVTEWGIFVEIIETRCEGLVRMSEMIDDYYEFDEKNFRIIGSRNKKIYSLGDHVHVSVLRTDIDRRTIDLELANDG